MTAYEKCRERELLEAWVKQQEAAGVTVHEGSEVRMLIGYLKRNPHTDPWSVRDE